MKLRAERSALLAALRTVAPVANGPTGLSILSGVRLATTGAGVELRCTDMQTTITAQVDADADDGSVVVVPAKLLAGVVGSLSDGAVEITAEDTNKVEIVGGDTHATLNIYDPSGWPNQTEPDGESVTLDEIDLAQLARVLPMASADKARPNITGLHLTGDQVMATDSYRCAVAALGVDVPTPASIVATTIAALLKAADGPVGLTVGLRAAMFTCGRTTWTTALIEQEFPAERIASFMRPESPDHWTFDAGQLVDEIKRVGVISSDEPLKLWTEGDVAHLRSTSADVGEITSTLPVDSDHDGAIFVNPDFLLQAITAAGEESVTFGLIVNELKPLVVRSEGCEQLVFTVHPGGRLR